MTASIRERVLARVAALLAGATAAGGHVYRSREVALSRDNLPAIVVVPDEEGDEPFGRGTDHHVLVFTVAVFTRGDPWDSLADAIAVPAHQLIATDAALRALVVGDIRKTASTWTAEEADQTAGCLVMRYRVVYLSSAMDISAAAN